jgi:hypothetical protein
MPRVRERDAGPASHPSAGRGRFVGGHLMGIIGLLVVIVLVLLILRLL